MLDASVGIDIVHPWLANWLARVLDAQQTQKQHFFSLMLWGSGEAAPSTTMANGEFVLGEDSEEEEEEVAVAPAAEEVADPDSPSTKASATDDATRKGCADLSALLSRSDTLRRHKKLVKRASAGLEEWKQGTRRETERWLAVDESLRSVHMMAKAALGDLQGAWDALRQCSSLLRN